MRLQRLEQQRVSSTYIKEMDSRKANEKQCQEGRV